jgi:glycosyltransferase involved in cell wall biosynthesis
MRPDRPITAMLRRNFKTDVQIVDLVWIDPAAFGIYTSAESNIKNLLADAGTNVVLVRAESNFAQILADVKDNNVRVIAIGERARLFKREAWMLWLVLRAKLQRRHVFYTSWMARFCLVVLLLPIKCRLFAHDLNSYRARVHDAQYPQPSFLSRFHQMLSIKRANVVQCFARSVARQLKLVRRDTIAVGDQTVRVIPAPGAETRGGAVIFLDDRSYKGGWALTRFYSSQQGFNLTVIGKIDAAKKALVESRGIAVRALRPTDKDKFKLLAESDYVIFASKYEGYGLPPREAAAVGTPALIARRAALLDIPAPLSLSIDALGDRIDLAQLSSLAAQIDRDALRQWAAAFLGPVSTSWLRTASLQ